MSKRLRKNTLPYTKAERLAEAELDRHLESVGPPSARSVFEQLRNFD